MFSQGGAGPPVTGRRRRKPLSQLGEMRAPCALSRRPIAPQRVKLSSSAACTKVLAGYSERCSVRKPTRPTATICTWILHRISTARFVNRQQQFLPTARIRAKNREPQLRADDAEPDIAALWKTFR